MTQSFVIYRSSAGSGKTYTLVKEYLLLALKNPHYNYRHILAITFTNKAMQEMKNRIISSLADFRDGKEHPMKKELVAGLNIPEEEFYRRCKILLEKILHEYSYFSISTIDAFFQRIIRSFTKELGLYGQYQLEMDQDLVKIQAIDNLLADLKEDEDLTHWVVKFAEEQLEEGKNWDIRKSLSGFAREIFKEHFAELEGDLPSAREIKDFQKKLFKEVKDFEGHLSSSALKAFEILQKANIEPGDFKYKNAGALSFFSNIREGKIKEPGKRSLNGCSDIAIWLSEKAPRYEHIAKIVEQELMPLLNDAIEYYERNHPRYCSAAAALKFIYGYGLLAELNRKVQQYKHERDLLFIQDATKLIKALMKDNDTPFIFEKVGTFFHHYLIDEFQDTSALQWHCLQPLVFDTISQGHMSMVVGDTKQSIYRWRGGDWSLLQYQVVKDITPHPHKVELLEQNFRSAGEIINFNNIIFKQLPEKMLNYTADSEELKSDTKVLAEQITEVYNEAHQLIPEEKAGKGYIHIKFINDEDHEERWTEQVLSLLTEQIDDVVERGYNLTDIALLVRKKGEAAQLAQHLLSFSTEDGNPKYPVLTNEALLLKNSRAVMVIINALRYMHSPADEIALNELIYHYQKINAPEQDLLFHDLLDKYRNVKKEVLPFDLAKEKSYLMHLPIEEAVEHLIRLFSLPGNSGEAAYLQTFQDKVLEFGRAEGNDIASFLLWWDEKGETESINVPSGLNAISIMTIHKAKGLQFPVVIVPFTSWAVESTHDTILWASSPEPPYSDKSVPLKYTGALKQSLFKDAYAQEQLQSTLDNLNLLYVAFTRAEQELYAYAPEKPSKKNISTYLKDCLSNEDFVLNKGWIPQHSSFEYGQKQQVEVREDKEHADQVMIRNYSSYDWRDRLIVKKVSSGHTGKMEEAIRGTEMHNLLSKIQYKEDLDEKSFFKSMCDDALKKQLREIISHPEIAGFFHKPYKVLNEKNILVGNDIFRPDRVVMNGTSAVIIDYKWGHKQDRYKDQIKKYLQLLKSLGYKETAGYLYYVDQKSVEKVS